MGTPPALGLDLGYPDSFRDFTFQETGSLSLDSIKSSRILMQILSSPTNVKPASVISRSLSLSHTNISIIVSFPHVCPIFLGIARSKVKNTFADFTSFSYYSFPNNTSI